MTNLRKVKITKLYSIIAKMYFKKLSIELDNVKESQKANTLDLIKINKTLNEHLQEFKGCLK